MDDSEPRTLAEIINHMWRLGQFRPGALVLEGPIEVLDSAHLYGSPTRLDVFGSCPANSSNCPAEAQH